METKLRTDITIGDICKGFQYDDNEGKGLFGMNGKLIVQPEYQRNYIYNDGKKDVAVVDSVLHGYPLGLIYLNQRPDGLLEVLDGQQRITSLGRFVTNKLTIRFEEREQKYYSLNRELQQLFSDTPLTLYICKGTESEIKNWFNIINIAGVPLNDQELFNAIYSGPFVTALKAIFSNSLNPMQQKWGAYVKGDPKRQDILAAALSWVSHGETEKYMAAHRQDKDTTPVTAYFDAVIDWASTTFTTVHSEQRGLPWGAFYDTYHNTPYNPEEVDRQVAELMADDAVTDKKGVFEYVLGGRQSPRLLNIRLFDRNTIKTVYARQTQEARHNGTSNCPLCTVEGGANKSRIYRQTEMDADHVTAWSKGGATDMSNCQMLCKTHNRAKGNR